MSCPDEALGAFPITDANPVGTDPRESAAFALAQAEIDKLTNIHTPSSVEWEKLAQACATVLRDEGKDFNAAVWLLCAWTQTRGLLGLATGIHVVRELLEHFWPSMTPPPSRLRARRNRAAWMLEWLETKLADSFTPLTQEQLHSVLEDWDAIDAFWRAHDDDGPAFFRLRRRLAQLPVQASAEPAPEPIAPPPPTMATSAPPVDTPAPSAPGAPPAPTSALATGAPLPKLPLLGPAPAIGALDSDEAIENAVTGTLATLSPLVEFCLESRTSLPLLFRLTRQMAWLTLEQPPPAQGHSMTTRLPPPPDSEVETLARLQSVGEPLDIVRFCERRLVAYPFWLDLNRVSHAALGRLGESAANAAASLAGEVRQLLARLPVLVELSFANGQPFADGATRSWLQGLNPVASSSTTTAADTIQTVIDQAQQSAANGQLKEALTHLQASLPTAGNGRDRFRLRKAQYELLDRFAPSPQLQVALAGLLRQAQEQRLAHWEPALVQPLLESALGYPSSDATTAWAEQLAALDLSAYWYLCSSKSG